MRDKIEKYLREKFGSVELEKFQKLGEGVHGVGYHIEFSTQTGKKNLILKTLFPEGFGHDHFSDRAQVLILANHSYNLLPNHIRSIDVIGLSESDVVSLGNCTEFFILMEKAKGRNYFNDLEKIRRIGLRNKDKQKAIKLSEYLVKIHKVKHTNPTLYKRRIRDLIGHGECLMGILDTYPTVNFVDDTEMTELVAKTIKWWSKLRTKTHRLCVVHGDYHPGNIWWYRDRLTLLDRSRGIYGEPADDVSCLSINYLFYALMKEGSFKGDFKDLFLIFFTKYLEHTNDTEMLEVIQPFYVFRVVVIANPLFYPNVTDNVRRKLFNFAQNILDTNRFEVDDINSYLS